MKTWNGILAVCTLLFPIVSLAQMAASVENFNTWDFVAPSIYDVSNISPAATGLLVYDSKTDSFYAKGPAGTGDWRSFGQGAAYSGTLSLGTCTTSKNVDWSKAAVFTINLTSGDACALSFSNAVSGQNITIWVTNDASSGGTGSVTWPTAKWPGGNVPTMTTGASKLDICTFIYNGSSYAGSCLQDMR